MLPLDPPVPSSSPLASLITRLTAALNSNQPAAIPPLQGLKSIQLVRWLYRFWLADQEARGLGWRPLIHLESRYLGRNPQEVITEAAHIASGGWLFLDGPRPASPPSNLLHTDSSLPLVSIPEAVASRISYLDRFHLPATDPALSEIRRSLLSHCRSCSPVHLSGPPGSGKQTLAWWAHATLDDRPLSNIRRGGLRRPVPGQWELYQEIGELDPDQLHHLRDRLQSMQEPPPAPFQSMEEGISRPRLPAFEEILGESPAISRLLAQAARIAPTPLSVLLLGESGCGKELLACALHQASGRAGQVVPVDISSMNENLVESELFGHVRGAFTGADRDRLGAIRQADGGTLFLDELGNLSPRNQARLLRVLQEKVVQPVGSERSFKVDIRVVAATHADLEGMIARGEFREDLYRRLNAVTLRLPPLRERGQDVLLLAEIFYKKALGLRRLPSDWLEESAKNALLSWRWPGNVRELQHVMEQAAVEAASRGDSQLKISDLGPLAPSNRRAVPLLTTSSELPERAAWGLERDLVQQLTAVTLRIPPLQDRPVRSIRAAILGLLEGRPIRTEALVALEKRAWWGNYPELVAAMSAIRSNIEGPVDLGSLKKVLPHLVLNTGRPPIYILLNPVLQPDGSVSGLQEDRPEGAILIGRVRSFREAERLHSDPRSRPRLEALKAALGPVQPGCLNLPQLPYLSRTHCVVTRTEHGLQIHALPGVSLPVFASSLSEGGVGRRSVAPGEPVSIGVAGELVVMNGTSIYLQLFLFAGAVAREEFAQEAARRISQESGGGETMQDIGGVRAKPLTVFELEGGELELLTGIVLRFAGGDFAAHLVAELEPLRHSEVGGRLCRYLVDSPRPTQYCTRLYEHASNEAARKLLAERLRGAGLERLPAGIERLIRPLSG